MKRQVLLNAAIAIVIVSLTAASLQAAPVIRISGYHPAHMVEVLTLDDWPSLGIYDDDQDNVFYTFCMEWSEYFRPGSIYYADISTAAVRGGETVEERGGEVEEKDPLDERTAYLYNNYMNGEYTGVSEQDIQDAIWFIEDEGGVENSLVTEATEAVADGDWSGYGGVRVLNLWKYYDPQTDTYSGWAQDQLVTVSIIPAPSAIMLSSIGLLTVRWLRRRKRL